MGLSRGGAPQGEPRNKPAGAANGIAPAGFFLSHVCFAQRKPLELLGADRCTEILNYARLSRSQVLSVIAAPPQLKPSVRNGMNEGQRSCGPVGLTFLEIADLAHPVRDMRKAQAIKSLQLKVILATETFTTALKCF